MAILASYPGARVRKTVPGTHCAYVHTGIALQKSYSRILVSISRKMIMFSVSMGFELGASSTQYVSVSILFETLWTALQTLLQYHTLV